GGVGGGGGGGEGVRGGGGEGGAGDGGDGRGEQRDRIAVQHTAVGVGPVGQEGQLGAALAEADIERTQGGDHIQPGGEARHHDQRHTGGHAQHKPHGDRDHVQDGDVLDPARIRQVEQQVGRCDEHKGGREQVGGGEDHQHQQD